MKFCKRGRRNIFILLCVCFLMTGCSQSGEELLKSVIKQDILNETGDKADTKETVKTEPTLNAEGADGMGEREVPNQSGEVSYPSVGALVPNLGGHYAYDRLDQKQQELYNAILTILLAGEREITVPTLDTGEIDKAFNCVLLDHPELFYVSGYSFVEYTVNGSLSHIDFSGTYTLSQEEVLTQQELINQEVERIYSTFPAVTSDYDIVKYFYEVIVLQTDYALHAADNQNICSVFLSHESVCQGYAKALQYLLLQEKIESVLVTGCVSSGEGHAWVIAKLDGNYYHIDPTWGDASYTNSGNQGEVTNLPEINYDYLCVTTDEITKSHAITETVGYPYCDSREDNFYVKEGLYFTEMDEGKLRACFEQAYSSGDSFLTFKCQDGIVFEEMVSYLLDSENAHIFDYLQEGMNQVIYSLEKQQYSLTIWL